MSYLFYIDDRNKTVLRPDCIKLCPELEGLTEQELLFIIKAYDHHSPLRRFPEEERIRRSMLDTFKDNVPKLLKAIESKDPHHRINVAIRAYKSLQYDPRQELISKYQQTIDETRESIHAGLTDKDMKMKLANIKELREFIRALDDEITESVEEEGQLKGDQDLSFLEKLQKNKDLYLYVTKKKNA